MRICIVGGTSLTYYLARSLLSKGHSLTIINRDQGQCEWFARRLKAVVVRGDGTSPTVMDDAAVASMDAVLAITSRDADNFLVCQIARLKNESCYVFALLNDPDNESIFRELGIQAAFSPARLLSLLIEQRVGYETITNLTPLADGKANLTEIVLSEDSPAVGRKLKDLDLPQGCLIVTVLRDGEAIIPAGSTALRSGDRTSLVSLPRVYARVLAILTGERGI
jgi:trk system potassium uptake protein TrkA